MSLEFKNLMRVSSTIFLSIFLKKYLYFVLLFGYKHFYILDNDAIF